MDISSGVVERPWRRRDQMDERKSLGHYEWSRNAPIAVDAIYMSYVTVAVHDIRSPQTSCASQFNVKSLLSNLFTILVAKL